MAAVLLIAVLISSHKSSRTVAPTISGGPPTAAAVPLPELRALVTLSGQPIYWAGPRRNVTYELTRSGRQIDLRYLPAGVQAGDPRVFLTIAARPMANALSATEALARQPGAVFKRLPRGGLAVYQNPTPTEISVAYPMLGYQLEVIAPSAAEARAVAVSGALVAVPGSAPARAAGPEAVSQSGLKAMSILLAQPIYWIGPQAATTYELTRKANELFLRYIPRGLPIGTRQAELTVGTYHVPNAYAITAAAAAQPDATPVHAGTGVVAFYRPARPQSVYLAFRHQDIQVEVYDTNPSTALALATSGQLRPVR